MGDSLLLLGKVFIQISKRTQPIHRFPGVVPQLALSPNVILFVPMFSISFEVRLLPVSVIKVVDRSIPSFYESNLLCGGFSSRFSKGFSLKKI